MCLSYKNTAGWLLSIGIAVGILFQPQMHARAGTNTLSSAPETNTAAPAVSALITGLEARLAQNGDDFSGWVLLAQSYLAYGCAGDGATRR